jgi:hypothetical protein
MPFVGRELASHDRRSGSVLVLEHFEQVLLFVVVERSEPEVIDQQDASRHDEHRSTLHLRDQRNQHARHRTRHRR